MQHLHTEYERELVPLFVKVLGDMRLSRSKLDEDAVERIKVIPNKMFPLPDQQRDLSRIKRSAMEVISIRNSHTPRLSYVSCRLWHSTSNSSCRRSLGLMRSPPFDAPGEMLKNLWDGFCPIPQSL